MQHALKALAILLDGRLIGDGSLLIRGVSSLEAVGEGEMTFAEDERRLQQALQSRAAAIVVRSTVKELAGRSGISVKDPKLAFALLLELFHPAAIAQGVVHPTAVLGEGIELSQPVDIHAHAVIGHRVRIGRGTIIEAGAYLGDDVTLGERCLIGPNAVIYRQTVIGHRVSIHGSSVIGGEGFGYVFDGGHYVKIPQIGNVVIEDDVEIGCNVCVDRSTIGSTVIQRGTKIDNLVQVAHNNRIGQHVILAGQVGLAGSVSIGDYSTLGGKVGVIDHIVLGPRTQVGAGSLVTKSMPQGGTLWGNPARDLQQIKRQLAAVGRLPALLKTTANAVARLVRIETRLGHSKPRRRRSK